MKLLKRVAQCLPGLLILISGSIATAGPVYQFSPGRFGDTVAAADVNDRGDILWVGFGDSYSGGAAYTEALGHVLGYDHQPNGVRVSDLNNRGELIGSAEKNGSYVPTMWIDGIPYDLTDPVNSGLAFVYDAGPKVVPFDLAALQVFGLPPALAQGAATAAPLALTNARGDLVFEYSDGGFCCVSTGILIIPEPPALPLSMGALSLLLMVSSRARKRGKAIGAQ